MKLAYIIICHKNPQQVSDLINQLNTPDTDFFVHIDKKAIDFDLPRHHNVFVLPDERRIDVRWGAKSMLMATTNAIHHMLQSENRYDYVFFMSGQDYPIKSNNEIIQYLHKHYGANFIEVLDHSDKLYKRYRKRNDVAYCKWMHHRSIIVRAIKKICIYLSGGHYHTFRSFQRKNTTGLEFEFGSVWWCLTYDCIQWISNYTDEHKEILDFFDYALASDECLIQTVFMASPYKETQHNKLTYLEWESNLNHPRIFTKEDFNLLQSSELLFARKFDESIDDEIIQLIKKHINNEEE